MLSPLASVTPVTHHSLAPKMAGLFHGVSTSKVAQAPVNPGVTMPDATNILDPTRAIPVIQQIDRPMSRFEHFKAGLKNLALVPVFPALGYYGLDATGVGPFIASSSDEMRIILGEGFGHAGMCFSLHFVISAGYHLWKTITG